MSFERGAIQSALPGNGKNLMLVFSNAQPGREKEFNGWYDTTHVPEVLEMCKEVKSCQRYLLSLAQLQAEQSHQYLAVYEFEGDPGVFLDNLQKANEKFDMNDSLTDARVIILQAISERTGA